MSDTDRTRERWLWLAALGVALAAVVVVVAGGVGHGRTAVAAASTSDDSVSVSGVGVVQGVPDTLTATFDVHVTRPTVQTALDAEATGVRRVLAALGRHGVTGRVVQTAALQLSQHYDNRGSAAGYDAFETVTARISPLRNAGAVISAAATAAGNEVSVDGLSFDIADDHSLLADARSKAYADARGRAQQYAQLAGRSLAAVMKVSEVVDTGSDPMPQRLAADAASAPGYTKSVPIRPGQQPVTVTVTVTWRLG